MLCPASLPANLFFPRHKFWTSLPILAKTGSRTSFNASRVKEISASKESTTYIFRSHGSTFSQPLPCALQRVLADDMSELGDSHSPDQAKVTPQAVNAHFSSAKLNSSPLILRSQDISHCSQSWQHSNQYNPEPRTLTSPPHLHATAPRVPRCAAALPHHILSVCVHDTLHANSLLHYVRLDILVR